MGKSLLRASFVVALLATLLSATPVLTQAPESAQVKHHVSSSSIQTIYIPAAADAFTSSTNPSSNYGGSNPLLLSYSGEPFWVDYILVRFDVASALPSGAIIDSATIQTYKQDEDPWRTYAVNAGAYFVTSPWTEGAVTFYSRPSSASIGVNAQIGASIGWYYWAATSFATTWQADPLNNYGVEIQSRTVPGDYRIDFTSREGGGNGPKLVVNYHLPATPTSTATPDLGERTPTATQTRHPPEETATPTPTATPHSTANCENILPNGDFEAGVEEPWRTTGTAQASAQRAHTGTQSMLLIEDNDGFGEAIAGLVLTKGADSITLHYWWKAVDSEDPEPLSDWLDVFVESNGGFHHWAHHTAADDPRRWNRGQIDLTDFGGQDTIIIFQARNGPSHPTHWYLDDVQIEVCGEGYGSRRLFLPLLTRG